jgi:hypothetical protein
MKYMLLILNDPTTFDPANTEKLHAEYMAFTQEILDSGEMLSGDPLEGPEAATCVRVRNGKRSVTDGPFAETKEALAGFYMIEARDLNEAIQIASKIPPAKFGSIEVRPTRELMVDDIPLKAAAAGP